jgi:hypothetical protein
MSKIQQHFENHLNRNALGFSFFIAIEAFLVATLIGILASILGAPERQIPVSDSVFLGLALIFAPIFETLFFQAIPILLVRLCKGGVTIQIIISTLCFFGAHLGEGILTAICAGIFAGFYFAFTFSHWAKKGKWKAIWVTGLTHFIYNSFAMSIYFIAKQALI